MRTPLIITLALGLVVTAAGCASESASADPGTNQGRNPNVVDIVASGHHELEAPEEIPSGWTTFRLHNRTGETHFALLDLLPEGKTVEDSRAEVIGVFQDAMDLINAGDPEAGFAEFANLPEWFEDVVYMGGPGFVAPGGTAETTVYLEPGSYVLECYVKTDGVFHTTHGMLTGLTVTEEESGAREPRADLDVSISEAGGIDIEGDVRPGKQTIAVHFADQAVHGNVLGHDVHIARVEDDTDLEDLASWLNWITALEDPAPAEFLGGTHDMPAGSTAYVTVNLKPGTYAFVAEVDDPQTKDMLRTVTVPQR